MKRLGRYIPRVALGAAAGVLLHGLAGWWSEPGFTQGSNITNTNSTTSITSVESPPTCTTIGSSHTEVTPTVDIVIGPRCIGIGNRDLANPSPACGGLPLADPPSDPFHGTVFLVLPGTTNFNINVHTETIQCVAAVPALPWTWLVALSSLLAGGAAWWMRFRQAYGP